MQHTEAVQAERHRPTGRLLLPLAGMLALVIVAAVLRLDGLGRDSLWLDETRTRQYALWPPWHPGHWFIGMAFYHTMMHVWVRIAGLTEFALRLPSVVFGAGAVALLVALVCRVNGWATALLAGLLLAVSWKHVCISQEARSYSLFAMLTVLSTLLLVRLIGHWTTRRLVVYGLVVLALAYTHYQFAFVVIFHTACVLIARRRLGWQWVGLLVALLVAFVPQLLLGVFTRRSMTWSPIYIPRPPGLIYAASTLQDYFGMPPYLPVMSRIPGATGLNLAALYIVPVLALAGIVACLQASGVRARKPFPTLSQYTAPTQPRRSGANWRWLPVVWFASVFVVPFVVAQAGKPTFLSRYLVTTLPAYCWLVACAVTALRPVALRMLLAAACLLCAVPALETMKAMPMRDDWRTCAETIAQNEQPGDCIVLCAGYTRPALRLYYHGTLPMHALSRRPMSDARTTQVLDWQEPPRRIWLVWRLAPESNTIDYFKRRDDYALVERWDLPPYCSFDMPPVILRGPTPIALFLFERVEPDRASPGIGQSVPSALHTSLASLHATGQQPTSPDPRAVLPGGSPHAAH